jgi:antitoxin ParD1/3/4
MSKNTSISLGNHFEWIIENGIKSGRFASASELIRAGLRLIEEEESKVQLLKEAIAKGEESGYVKKFDPIKHLASLNNKHAK